MTPQEIQQQIQSNHSFTIMREKLVQNGKNMTVKCTILIVVVLLTAISLAAIVLSVVSYNTSDLKMLNLKTSAQGTNLTDVIALFNIYKTDMEFMLMKLNSTLLQLDSEQNIRDHNITQLKIGTNLLLSQLKRNISRLFSKLDTVKSNITTVKTNISKLLNQLEAVKEQTEQDKIIRLLHCGTGEWHRVAYLNMTDPSQQCPSTWSRKVYNSQFRACGRPDTTTASCPANFYSISRQYSKVCGRVNAIQFATPDAFHSATINEVYLDGVSITHGTPRKHIWSFVSATNERDSDASQSPSFVGRNYYCESGNPAQDWHSLAYINDKLWDGELCRSEGTCCTGGNTPPWFSVSLRSPTSDDIEVRICGNQGTTDEDTPIELLELYVQ